MTRKRRTRNPSRQSPLPDQLAALLPLLDETMLRDRRRLSRELRRLGEVDGNDETGLAQWRERVESARARYASRARAVTEIRIDESLPIAARSDEIVKLIRKHQVIVLAGETGSGKSTQLPKLCLAAGRGLSGLIGCTQPRRLAARSVARRVATELGSEVGGIVGYQVRFSEKLGESTLIKFMTDGILLAETQADPWLNAYDTIVLDEAHERSLNIDFLLGYLKRLFARRRDLKLIVTSATIDTRLFAKHFGDAPVVDVEGRSYPVEVRWKGGQSAFSNLDANAAQAQKRHSDPLSAQIVAALDEISREDPRGDVLVFLPGEREIRDAHLSLERRKYRATEILPLYARLSAAEQDRVFRPGPQRRVVLATNVAETSLTVPRIRYVIDTGTARVKRYSTRNQLERLQIEPISRAAADQRKGRCGRVGPGACIRLYDEDDYNARPRFTDPEILRSSLAGVILRMLSLKLGEVEKFPFVEAPNARAISDGYRRLSEISAIDHARQLTDVGREMARWPIDVALARMLIEAQRLGVMREMLILVAFLSIQDPRERPAEARQAADQAHAAFADPHSDFVGALNLWRAHATAHEELTQSKLRDWCRERFLSYLRMREWRELHRQLLLQSREVGNGKWKEEKAKAKSGDVKAHARTLDTTEFPLPTSDVYEAIHRCLLSGWPTQVGRRDERQQYEGTRDRKFQIFPGSTLVKHPPRWLLSGQILGLRKVYAMLCARVEPEWIEQQAGHLVRREWREPHWSRKRGAVLAFEQVTLFGLTLVEKRSVQFGRQDPAAAHAVFVREALVRGDIDTPADCIAANMRVLAQAHELEAKRRRTGLVRDEDGLVEFFAGKLPGDIHTAAAFDAWYRKAGAKQQVALRWSLDDVLSSEPGLRAGDFPPTLEFAGHPLRLEYRFVPGDAADGITLHVPLAFVNAVSAARCEWLVPGLLAEKVAGLIRGLPKSLRRNFVPAPDFARAFAEAESPRDESLAHVLAAYLRRVTGVEISAGEFSPESLPPHLSMHFRVYDENGETLAQARDIDAIRADWGERARRAFSRRAASQFTRTDVDEFDQEIPAEVVGEGDLIAYPALVDLGESVAVQVFENAHEAAATHRLGVARLLRKHLHTAIKQARRQLPIERKLALKYAAVASVDSLREDIVEAALMELLAESDLDVRTRESFRALQAHLEKALFARAVDWLTRVEETLAAYAELKPWLEPPMLGFASASYDDLHEQLGGLVYPGFVRALERECLAQIPRYLRAMHIRAERLRQDPTRDQARMLTLRSYWSEYLKLRAERNADDADLLALRWLIEELRVSLFAQELKTATPVSPKRIAAVIQKIRALT